MATFVVEEEAGGEVVPSPVAEGDVVAIFIRIVKEVADQKVTQRGEEYSVITVKILGIMLLNVGILVENGIKKPTSTK